MKQYAYEQTNNKSGGKSNWMIQNGYSRGTLGEKENSMKTPGEEKRKHMCHKQDVEDGIVWKLKNKKLCCLFLDYR